ncbi:MAG: glycoside hydrolase family 15 protein, partial [Thermomicrobiaceae bacterium]|nr:glycoside hydrolase family 15 protein [Thermomicrobiaceae bacterium]
MSARSSPCDDYPPIADYAVVGDCHTAALVARDGGIDWLCPARFDAPALFCRLLDAERGGTCRVAPREVVGVTRRYRGESNVLETTFGTPSGRVRLTDVMPVHRRQESHRGYDVGTSARFLRLVEALDGDAEVTIAFRPTFDFARAETRLQIVPGFGAVADDGRRSVSLAAPDVTFERDARGGAQGTLRLRAGERRWLVLSYREEAAPPRQPLTEDECDGLLAETLDYWKRWIARCIYHGPYHREVHRSALALKLLTYEPTGAIVAAPTTSLPEQIGGERNWDYRFTWLRDATLILYALMTIGYHDEAADFFDWLDRTEQRDPSAMPQIMYTIDGASELPERTLDHLAGYRCSRPVRVGNAAAGQFQLDIFGEVLSAAYLYYHHATDGPYPGKRPSPEAWALLRGLVEQAARHWQDPDRGIWEVRGGDQKFLYSRLMCWAALDRGIRLAREYGLQAPVRRWAATREAIRHAILTDGYDEQTGAFTQAFGNHALDASALAIPLTGFLPATDPRVRSTVERIRHDLTRNGLVDRYRTPDGLPGGEGTFLLCTFWLVDALALGGQLDDAHELFEHAVGFANDVGLLSEEVSPDGTLLGNFPQGFTHLALIQAAVNLAKAARHGAEEKPENESERAHRARRAAEEGASARSAP